MKLRLFLLAGVLLMAASVIAQNAQDFSKVEIKTTKLTDKFYTLEGQGGTIGALVGPDGVFLVDTQFAPLTEKIVAAVKKISSSPIKFVVNTHVHGDHTGGNENFGKMGDDANAHFRHAETGSRPWLAAAAACVEYHLILRVA